jgi:excisionase family DNA binding protein
MRGVALRGYRTGRLLDAEAADRLGVSLRTVQLWSEAGLLRAWKTPGGHRRILTASIDELLKRRTGVGARRAPGGSFQVLVVEDEPDFRQLFELHLRSWGLPIHLTSAPSGFEALLQIGASRPDLLITDLRMPGIDGFEMLRALKASGTPGRTRDHRRDRAHPPTPSPSAVGFRRASPCFSSLCTSPS